jgi:hypothetical protein
MVDVDVLYEVWSMCKEYIPAKDRATAADHVVNELMDMMGDTELKDFCERDHYLSDARASYGIDNDNDEEVDD